MSTTGIKKIIFFYIFFVFFIFFSEFFLHSFFTENQYRGKRTEKDGRSGGRNSRKRAARKLRLRRYGTVRPERGAGRRRTEDVPGIKKAPPCGGKAFLNEKNCGCAGGPSLWRAVEHRWVIFVCALLFCILRFRMFFNKSIFAFFYFFIITGNFLDD